MDNGADIEREIRGLSLLAISIIRNNPAMVKLLLKKGAYPNHFIHGMTPLSLAALCNLSKEYTVNTIDYDTNKLLTAFQSLEGFIDADVSSNKKTITLFCNTPYQIEDINEIIAPLGIIFVKERLLPRDINILKLLLHYKADINLIDQRGWTTLMYVCPFGVIPLVKFLVNNKAKINIQNNEGQTPLTLAVQFDRTATVRFLLDHGAHINEPDPDPLFWAASYNAKNTATLLLEHGADINRKNSGGLTSLMLAAEYGFTSILSILIAHKASLNLQDNQGLNALMLSAEYGRINCVNILLDAGAALNMQDSEGSTALMRAAITLINMLEEGETNEEVLVASRDSFQEITAALLARGAQVNIPDNDGATALTLAVQTNTPSVVTQLLNTGAHINHQDQNGATPLIIAAEHGYQEVVQILLAGGADKNLTDVDGKTALDLASENGHEGIVTLLSE